MNYIQRYPFANRAVWWKKYTNAASLRKRTIYVATNSLGFEIIDHRTFNKVALLNGKLKMGEADYKSLTGSAIKLFNKFYVFNSTTNNLEEHDLADEGLNIIEAQPSEIMVIEKNTYLKRYAFDCTKESDQQDSSYQPISGLMTNSSYLTIKTHNFSNAKDEPAHEDLLFYQGRFWAIEDTSKTYIYTPREKTVLHLSLKALNR